MSKHIRKECECCGVEEDLHIRSSNSIYDIKSGTIRLEMTYLCTKCKEKNKDRLKFSQAVGEIMEQHKKGE
jgi:hypothetical protein